MSNAAELQGSQSGSLSAVAIIPARLGSTRLPRKMLLRETGRFLFEHTVRNLEEASVVDLVLLATDSEEIMTAAAEVGVAAILTDAGHKSGTDRVHEAYGRLLHQNGTAYDVILNVQGDEPEVAPEDLRELIQAFSDPLVEFATLWVPPASDEEFDSSSAVKVTLDGAGNALYFSRSAIPNRSHQRTGNGHNSQSKRHVGVYAFRPAALRDFCALPEGQLELDENLEQLRWLEAGRPLRVLRAKHAPNGIDTREDYLAFVARQSNTLSNPPTA